MLKNSLKSPQVLSSHSNANAVIRTLLYCIKSYLLFPPGPLVYVGFENQTASTFKCVCFPVAESGITDEGEAMLLVFSLFLQQPTFVCKFFFKVPTPT